MTIEEIAAELVRSPRTRNIRPLTRGEVDALPYWTDLLDKQEYVSSFHNKDPIVHGGSLGLYQLCVYFDGHDNPPILAKRFYG